ncbi:MAG TPA: hypothetical protein VL588_11095, partial [Bdellovibrionota bacterium]|nr:hypothetical protein [Bdellovibrionota bacterium]
MKSNRLGLALTCALVLALSPLAVLAKKPPTAAKATGMSSKNRAQCKKYRTAQVDHYKQLADEYHKVC